jgi:hypothetical protein
MNSKRYLAMAICLLASSVPAVSPAAEPQSSPAKSAGRYRLDLAKGWAACEAFLKNLNAFPASDPPMLCEQKIHPTHPEFSKPKWRDMDVQGNLRLIYDAEIQSARFTPAGNKPKPFDEWVRDYQAKIKSGAVKPILRKVVLDINGNGPETLIWYQPWPDECEINQGKGLPGRGGAYIFVQRTQGGKVEPVVSLSDNPHDVFIYKGRPYFSGAGPSYRYHPPKGGRPGWSEEHWRLTFQPLINGSSRNSYGWYGLHTEMCTYTTLRLPSDFAPQLGNR